MIIFANNSSAIVKNTPTYFRSYTSYLKEKFGSRVQKLSVHAGMTCPNRDGSKGTEGCIYCLNEAFTPSYCTSEKTITQQIAEGIEFHRKRYRRASKYLVYFQAYSNTYTEPETLQKMFEEALSVEGISGITAGTRPDCISSEIAEVLAYYSKKTSIKVELGIESVYDDTLRLIMRGHSMDDTFNALDILHRLNIPTGGHFIFGLPGEGKNRLPEMASIISKMGLMSVKLHQLQILKGTPLEQIYRKQGPRFPLFELAEYIDFIVDFAERLHPDIYIERFAAEVPPRYLVAPDWGNLRYDNILQLIIKRFEKRNSFQGKYYQD